MAASDPKPSQHNFRYLVKPGTDFGFVAKFRVWIALSTLLSIIAIGSLFVNKQVRGNYLNWTIDFKGGTEIIYAFKDKANVGKYVRPDAAKVRAALEDAPVASTCRRCRGAEEQNDEDVTVRGIMIRTPRFGATTKEQQAKALEAFTAKFADRGLDRLQWSETACSCARPRSSPAPRRPRCSPPWASRSAPGG